MLIGASYTLFCWLVACAQALEQTVKDLTVEQVGGLAMSIGIGCGLLGCVIQLIRFGALMQPYAG